MQACESNMGADAGASLARIAEQLAGVDVTGDPVAGVASLIEDLRGASSGLRRSSAIATVAGVLADEVEACLDELPAEVRERLAGKLARVRAAQERS